MKQQEPDKLRVMEFQTRRGGDGGGGVVLRAVTLIVPPLTGFAVFTEDRKIVGNRGAFLHV